MKREDYIKVYLTEDEKEKIQEKVKRQKLGSTSSYVRSEILEEELAEVEA